MNALSRRIADLIAAQGPLSIAQFMALALHDAQAGYYATRDPFGRGGDFITAPEVSQIFGELVGLWIAQSWLDQGAPAPARLIELGPGRGTLMADALRAIAKAAPDFFAAIDVAMVETSPTLRAVQRQTLDAFDRIRWLDRFGEAAGERPVFVIANEFFDALPIRQYVMAEDGWHERMVTCDSQGALVFALAPVPAKDFHVPQRRGPATPGAVYEIAPSGLAIMDEIAGTVAQRGGAVLAIDYGYYEPGFADTLQAMKAHKYADILATPGEADLTAHVDFSALAAAATAQGAKAHGPVTQAQLLEALGIRERAAMLARANPQSAADQNAAVARLIDARQMGTLFKALAILPATAPAPPGF